MATLGTLTLKLRATRKALALDLLQSKQEVEQWQQQMTPLLNLKAGVKIDWDSFSNAESEIRRWVDSLPKTDLRVGAKFVGADLAQNIQELERLLANPLKILVDDTRLFELNEHFKLKERDYKQLQNVLSSPLEIKVDRSQLDNLSRDLRSIENTPQVNLRANVNTESLRSFHEQLNRYSQGRTLELATSVSRTTLNALQNDLKSLASNLTTARVSVQIDSQLQALRSELGNLPNVMVGVSIDDSALGKFDRKLGKRQLGLGVNSTDIGNIEETIGKLGKKLDSLKPASGLFKALTFAPTQIATGFLEGVGKNLSNGLGKGYSQGIEAALGDTIGSTELLGRKLAESIANRGKSAIAQLVPTAISDAIKQSINQALGEAEVFVESRSKQATASQGQRKKKAQSREGVAEERREATRDYEDNGFVVSALTARSNQLEQSYQAKATAKSIIDAKIDGTNTGKSTARSQEKLKVVSEDLGRNIQEKSTIKNALKSQQDAVPEYSDRWLKLDQSISEIYLQELKLSKTKKNVDKKIVAKLTPESKKQLESTSAKLDFDLGRINEEQITVGKQLRNAKNAYEQSERRVVRADTVYNTLKPTQLPKVYREAIGDVPENLIPEIRVDRGLAAKGADATYSAKSNRIKVSPELYQGIQSGNLTQEQFKVMYHELQHGKDFKFGQFDGLVDRDNLEVRKPLKATAQEVKDVAPFLSQYKPELREVEQNAEIAGRRASKKVYEQQQQQALSTQLTNAYGLGGIKLDKVVNTQAVEAAKRTISINQLGEQSGISSPSAAKIVDRAITLKDRQKQIGLDIAKAANGELSTSQIEELQSRINKQVEGVENLSKRIDALKKSILKRVEQSKQVIPQPVETNIADPWAKSEEVVIDRDKAVEVAARAGQALKQTIDTGRSIASGVKNSASNIATGAKSNYGLLQYGEAMLMNASPQARLIKSQLQTNIGDRIDDARYQIGSAVNASGQFAGSVYRGLKAAESVPLGLLPGGYTAKKLIQNVAVPTALFSAAHAVPGLNMMLDAASGGIHALAGGAGNLLSNGATSGMANFVSQALGSVPFSESVVPAVQQGLGAALNATITGGAEAAATFGAPVLIGKSIANMGTKSLGTGLQKLAQSNPLLPPAQTPLRLKPKAEPEYEYVEVQVQAKAAEASANKNPPTSNLPLNLPERKKEAKSVELAPPKLITQITESDGLARGKTLAKQFQNASKQIKEALKKGELELAFAMSQQMESFAKGATTEIANITSLLGDKAAFGTTLGSQLANTKSQITKARNIGIRAATVYQNSNPPSINDDELASLKPNSNNMPDLFGGIFDPNKSTEYDRYQQAELSKDAPKRSKEDRKAFTQRTKFVNEIIGTSGNPSAQKMLVDEFLSQPDRNLGISNHTYLAGSLNKRIQEQQQKLESDRYGENIESQRYAGRKKKGETSAEDERQELARRSQIQKDFTERERQIKNNNSLLSQLNQPNNVALVVPPATPQVPITNSPLGRPLPPPTPPTPPTLSTPLGRPLPPPPPPTPPVPPNSPLGRPLPPPDRIIPELAAKSFNQADLIASIEEKLNYFDNIYPQAENQVRGSEKRGRKNTKKFLRGVDRNQDLFDSSFSRIDRESSQNLEQQIAKTQNLNDRVFTEDGIIPLGKNVDSLVPKLSNLKEMGAKIISVFAGFAGVAFVGRMLADWGAAAFQAAAKMESLRTTVGAVTSSSFKAQATIARSTTESNKLGYNAVAGLENDAGFFASTRTTALELAAPDIMTGLKQYNRVMGVDENRAKLAQTAVVQMAGKGKITAEELFGQLAESSPGAVNVLSRSMGLSVGQLRKEMEFGSLNANDALPRFGNQLAAESLGSVDKASESGAASVGRLQNSFASLQTAIGDKIMAPTIIGLNTATGAANTLKNNIDTLGKVFVAALLSAAASAVSLAGGLGLANKVLGFLISGLISALPLLKTFALQTAIAYAAIEVFNTVMASINDSSPFKSLADESEAAFAKISKGASQTAQDINKLKDEIYGKDRTVFQVIGDGISGAFGGQTSITKKAADDTVNADRILDQNEKALKRKPPELTEANRNRRNDIDLELSIIRSQNANLTSKDRDKIDLNNKREQQLIQERSTFEKPINTRQAELEQVVKNTNNIIDSPLRNSTEKASAATQLAEAEKEQRNLQQQLVSSASTLAVGLRGIGEGLQAGLAAIDLASINRKTQTYLAATQDVRNTGAFTSANFADTNTNLSAKQSLQQQAVSTLKSTIYSPENRSTVKALGVDPENVSQEQIDRLKSTVTDTRGQSLLGYLSKYQQVKTELAQTNQSLFESQYSYIKSIADYNKQLTDKVISLDNKLVNLQISARNSINSLQQAIEEQLIEIDRTSGKAMLQAQKNRMQTAYNKFLDKLGISTDDIFEQIFQNYSSIIDSLGQMSDRRLNTKQSGVTAKYREKNNESRKTQVQTEQSQSNSEARRQSNEEKLNNPLNQLNPSSSETPPPTPGQKTNLTGTIYKSRKSGLIVPVVGATNSRGGGYKEDTGLDIMTPIGSSVVASGAGTLEYAEDGHSRQIGEDVDPTTPGFQKQKSIRVKLDNPVEYNGKSYQYQYYTHLRSIDSSLYNKGTHSRSKDSQQSVRVEAGQFLGETGTAGGGPHLHTGFSADREQRNYLNYQEVNDVLFGTKDTSRKAVGKVDPIQNVRSNSNSQVVRNNNLSQKDTFIRTGQQEKTSYTNVVSSFYTPGEGGAINGGNEDIRGKYIDRYSHVMATRTTASPQGIPYGATVELRNPANGKTTIVRNVDRGTLRPGRDIDLTPAPAKNLGVTPDGLANLQMRVIAVPKGQQIKDSYDLGGGIGSYDRKGNYTGKSGTIIKTNKSSTQTSATPKDIPVDQNGNVDVKKIRENAAGDQKLDEQRILNKLADRKKEELLKANEQVSKAYVEEIKVLNDIDTSNAKGKLRQDRNLANQQDQGDLLNIDTKILQNRNLINRNVPIFNRKTVQIQRDASAYNRSADRTPYQQLDKLTQQYGGTPDTTALDTSITTAQSNFDRIKEDSRTRRENILKQIQSIEAQGAGWSATRKALALDIQALRKRGETIKADKLQQVVEDNDRAFGTPQARQKTIDGLSDQYRRLPSDGIAGYDAIAPGTAKVLTDYQALNQEYQPKTFNDNLQAQGRSIVQRFKSIKDTIETEYNTLGEAAMQLEAEIQAKLKAAGYAPQLIDVKDPERLKLLQKVAPEETKRLVSAVGNRDKLGVSSKQVDVDAETAAARTVSIAKQREQINVDRANTDYLESTQGRDISARIQIDKQKFNTGKTELDLQLNDGSIGIDLYNAKLNQLTLETNTLRNAMLPLREASSNFFQDIFKGKSILEGIGDAFRNLAIGILTNLQNLISQKLGEQLFGTLLKGAEGIQDSANGKKTGNMLLDQVAPAVAQALGFRSPGAKSNTNNGMDISLNQSPLDEESYPLQYDVPPSRPYSSPRGIQIPQLAVNAYESYRKTQVDPSFIGPVYQPQEQRKQRSIGDQVGSMVLGGALQLLGLPGFANGGMVTSPTVALIGEGINNEAIVPLPNGRSIPVDLKGMGESSGSNSNISNAISVTIQNSGQAKETSRGDANAIASLVQNLVTQGLINERRPGGLLS